MVLPAGQEAEEPAGPGRRKQALAVEERAMTSVGVRAGRPDIRWKAGPAVRTAGPAGVPLAGQGVEVLPAEVRAVRSVRRVPEQEHHPARARRHTAVPTRHHWDRQAGSR